jgi:uncharacterized SAM-binding protein YcdF (DUF218 family)
MRLRMSSAKRILLALIVVIALVFGAAVITYETIPRGNTDQSRFDAIIVLGYPANADGSPSPIQRARVLEGVREYRAGVAPRLIMTGGAAHNTQVEAAVMARFAEKQGVPESAVIVEPQAHDTIQNAFYSVRIMQAHGWQSAEVVSSPSHLARASLIFSHFPIRYRTQASKPGGFWYECVVHLHEMRVTDRTRLFGFKPTPYLPAT